MKKLTYDFWMTYDDNATYDDMAIYIQDGYSSARVLFPYSRDLPLLLLFFIVLSFKNSIFTFSFFWWSSSSLPPFHDYLLRLTLFFHFSFSVQFLDAFSHLYKRVCPAAKRQMRPSSLIAPSPPLSPPPTPPFLSQHILIVRNKDKNIIWIDNYTLLRICWKRTSSFYEFRYH